MDKTAVAKKFRCGFFIEVVRWRPGRSKSLQTILSPARRMDDMDACAQVVSSAAEFSPKSTKTVPLTK
jgi:hypothetical protein